MKKKKETFKIVNRLPQRPRKNRDVLKSSVGMRSSNIPTSL